MRVRVTTERIHGRQADADDKHGRRPLALLMLATLALSCGSKPPPEPPPTEPAPPPVPSFRGSLKADADATLLAAQPEANCGGSPELTLGPGQDAVIALRFPVAELQGFTVEQSVVALQAKDRIPETLTVAAVPAAWVEGDAANPTMDRRSASFRRTGAAAPWAQPGSHVLDAVYNDHTTPRAEVEVKRVRGGLARLAMPNAITQFLILHPEHALILAAPEGLDGEVRFASRQGGQAPVLAVSAKKLESSPPNKPEGFASQPAEDPTGRGGLVALTWRPAAGDVGEGADAAQPACYEVRYSRSPITVANWGTAVKVAQTLVPLPPQQDAACHLRLYDLMPDTRYHFALRACSATGAPSSLATTQATTSGAVSPATLPSAPLAPTQAGPRQDQAFVYAVPECAGVNPQTGRTWKENYAAAGLAEPVPQASANRVWDAQAKEIRLEALRGESTGCQIILDRGREETLDRIRVRAEAPDGVELTLRRVWYVRAEVGGKPCWLGDPLAPLRDDERLPSLANPVPRQQLQSYHLDVRTSPDTRPGSLRGNVTVQVMRLGLWETVDELTINLRVLNAILPTAPFTVEIQENRPVPEQFCLVPGSPEHFEAEQGYYRMARMHGLRFLQCPRGEDRHSPPGAMDLERRGARLEVQSWRPFDARYGSVLKQEGIDRWLLPVQAQWPNPLIRGCVRDKAGVCRVLKDEYARALQQVAGAYAQHLQELAPGVTPLVQINSGLIEPERRVAPPAESEILDQLLKTVRAADDAIEIRLRLERPMAGQAPSTGDATGLAVVGQQAFVPVRHLGWGRIGGKVLLERHAADATQPATLPGAVLRAWTDGAGGLIIPRATGTGRGWNVAQAEALLLPGVRQGVMAPLPSLRLKALRRARQDVDLLVAAGFRPAETRRALLDQLGEDGDAAEAHVLESPAAARLMGRLRRALRTRLQ